MVSSVQAYTTFCWKLVVLGFYKTINGYLCFQLSFVSASLGLSLPSYLNSCKLDYIPIIHGFLGSLQQYLIAYGTLSIISEKNIEQNKDNVLTKLLEIISNPARGLYSRSM